MGDDAWVVAAMLKMMGRLVEVRRDAARRGAPEGLLNAIDFTIKYFERAVVSK